MEPSDSQVELWEKKQTIIDWVRTPLKDRKQSRRGLAQKLGVGQAYIEGIEAEICPADSNKGDEFYDSEKWLKERTPQMDKALLKACETGNATALGLYYKLNKRLVEQSETKIKLEISAEDYAREHSENRRWLREHNFLEETRMGQVRSESALLPENIREGEGQTQGNNSV